MWGSPVEIERHRRIKVAAWAYAYEVENDPLVDDNTYDMTCLQVDPTIKTGDKKLDKFFREEFNPSTGMWIHNHPDLEGVKRVVGIMRKGTEMFTPTFSAISPYQPLVDSLKKEINDYTAKLYSDGHRKHLGASEIGKKCDRELWYKFRWVLTPSYIDAKGVDQKGRMLRLFNRGHREEFRIIEWLRGIGFTVEEFDPESRLYYVAENNSYHTSEMQVTDLIMNIRVDVTGDPGHQEKAAAFSVKRKQLRIEGVDGHFGGSLDAIITWPERYGPMPKMLAEFKTANQKQFDKLADNGMNVVKPEHFRQMCVYGQKYGLTHGLYFCSGKNDDDIYPEIVELKPELAEQSHLRAEKIIRAQTPPPKLHENSAHFDCKYCDFAPVCHGQAAYEKNCRSCKFSAPGPNKSWVCGQYGQTIPETFIVTGCDSWQENR